MYTLRVIEPNGVVENHSLGKSYARVRKAISTEFDSISKKMYPNYDTTNVESLICGENEKVFFIMDTKDWFYFIMSESGQTFEKL